MKICVVGTGYVGLVSGACLADVGNTVWCIDIDEAKVRALKEGRIPIYEPGLEEVVHRNIGEKRLFCSTELKEGLKDADVCFITVDTPPDREGRADLTSIFKVAKQIGELLDHAAIVVTKSTVPVGTTMRVKDTIATVLIARGLDPSKLLSVASNPEFLKEGAAVDDFMSPDRVIVGVEDEWVGKRLHELYAPFMRRQDRFLNMSIPSAELAKYAVNSMLATRISFINEIARACDKVGADVADIRLALASDPRIGPDFLYAGLGYGGSCLPKDAQAIAELGKEHGAELTIIEAASRANGVQRAWFWQRIVAHFGASLKGRPVAIWGLAFKANTDDVRFSPALYIVERFLEAGARVSAFDPVAFQNAMTALGSKSGDVSWTKSAYDAVEGAEALIVCTEWREFRSPDFNRIKKLMKSPVIFDGRNLYDPAALRGAGFTYISVGRP